jgi:hypothetical protein
VNDGMTFVKTISPLVPWSGVDSDTVAITSEKQGSSQS